MIERLLGAVAVGLLATTTALVPGDLAVAATPTTYYVSNAPGTTCSDAVATPTQQTPWCSPEKVNGVKQPGDRILFGAGSAWNNQQVVLTGTGTAAQPVTIGTYGQGPRPHLSLSSTSSGHRASRALIELRNPSFWQVSGLELSHAAAGVLARYGTGAGFAGQPTGNQSLSFTDLHVHHIGGIRQGVPLGTGSPISPACTGTAAHPQSLDLWQSGGVAVTGAYTLQVPTTSWFVSGVTFRDIEGHNNLNVVNVDTCDAQLGDPDTIPGRARPHLVRDVVVDNVWAYDGDGAGYPTQCNEGMRFAGVTGLRVTSSRMQNLGACPVNTGTAGVILVSVTDATFTNNTITDVPDTGSPDMTGVDNEIYVDRIAFHNNLFARHAGAGVEFLSLRCGIADYNTAHVLSGNSFHGNGKGSFLRLENCNPGSPFTGRLRGSLLGDATFVTPGNAFAAGWQLSDNVTLAPGDAPHHAGDQFGAVDGASGWTYETTDGSGQWVTASWVDGDHVSGYWSGGESRGRIAPFEQTGGACAGCASSRTWTAPRDGTVVIRSRALKSRPGGSGAQVRIVKDGLPVAQASVAAGDHTGVDVETSVEVRGGDQLRFVVSNDVPSSTDWVSWAPSIAYLPTPVASTNGDVADGGFGSPSLSTGSFSYAPAGAVWDFAPTVPGVGGAGIVTNGSAFGNPSGGDAQAAFVQQRGSLGQQISGLRPGKRYAVRLRAAQRPGHPPQTLQVWLDGRRLDDVTPSGGSYAAYTTASFAAGDGVHRLEVRGTSTADATAFVDQVAIVVADDDVAVANAGFESPVLADARFSYAPTGAGWTFSPGAGVFSNGAREWSGVPVPQGRQAAFLQGQNSVTGTVTVPAQGTYAVFLSSAQRSGTGAGGQTVEVLVDGAVASRHTPGAGWGTHATAAIPLSAGTHTVTVRTTASGDRTALVDDVRVAAVVPAGSRNGSFESPGLGRSFGYGTTGAAPWRFQPVTQHGGSGVSGNGSPMQATPGGDPALAPDGTQLAFVQRDAVLTGGDSFLSPGLTYVVTLDARQRVVGGRVNAQQLRLEVDGVSQLVWTPAASWQSVSVVVSVPPSARGRLTVVGTRAGTDETAFIDDLRVAMVR